MTIVGVAVASVSRSVTIVAVASVIIVVASVIIVAVAVAQWVTVRFIVAVAVAVTIVAVAVAQWVIVAVAVTIVAVAVAQWVTGTQWGHTVAVAKWGHRPSSLALAIAPLLNNGCHAVLPVSKTSTVCTLSKTIASHQMYKGPLDFLRP